MLVDRFGGPVGFEAVLNPDYVEIVLLKHSHSNESPYEVVADRSEVLNSGTATDLDALHRSTPVRLSPADWTALRAVIASTDNYAWGAHNLCQMSYNPDIALTFRRDATVVQMAVCFTCGESIAYFNGIPTFAPDPHRQEGSVAPRGRITQLRQVLADQLLAAAQNCFPNDEYIMKSR